LCVQELISKTSADSMSSSQGFMIVIKQFHN